MASEFTQAVQQVRAALREGARCYLNDNLAGPLHAIGVRLSLGRVQFYVVQSRTKQWHTAKRGASVTIHAATPREQSVALGTAGQVKFTKGTFTVKVQPPADGVRKGILTTHFGIHREGRHHVVTHLLTGLSVFSFATSRAKARDCVTYLESMGEPWGSKNPLRALSKTARQEVVRKLRELAS